MAKATKARRKAREAMDDAARAAKQAKRIAKELPRKSAKKVRALMSDARNAADASKRAVRRRPERVAKRARKATDRLLVATDSAMEKAERKAARRAEAKHIKAVGTKSGARESAPPLEPDPLTELDVAPAVVEALDLSRLTVTELRRRARESGETGYSRLTKAQLVDLLS